MSVVLFVEAEHISLTCGSFDRRRPLAPAPLADLSRRYALTRERADPAALLAIGRALYAWLDGTEGWLTALRAQLPRPFVFEVRAALQPEAAAWSVLYAPWELLADEGGFLAADTELRYAPARRLGRPVAPPALDSYRLGVAFMAAAPRGAKELDFEAEEAAIMEAAGQNLDLFVEDSGEGEQLGRRLGLLKPPLPVLHLSCHGDNAWRGNDGTATPQSVLMLEDATGAGRPTPAGALLDALGAYRPRLLFLSACLTSSAAERSGTAPEVLSDSLASRLVRSVPVVLGWDGSVADAAATAFARELYDDLGKGVSAPLAAAAARRALLNGSGATGGGGDAKDAQGGAALRRRLRAEAEVLRRDWHLARVWLGPEGGGPVVDGDLERSLLPPGGGHKVLLAAKRDARLDVADPAMFVGRRRELQAALRVLSGRDRAGLLLHGMGRLGKSSLAARIIDRRPDLAPVVVFGAYDALSVVDALAHALEDHESAAKLLAERKPLVRDDPAALRPLLVQLLAGPCKWANDGGRPLLLLIDDLERILEADPAGGRHRVRAAERPVLSAVLHAFDPRRSNSRLLLTSRFPFTLAEGGRDLAAGLGELELDEFGETARDKLSLRQIKAAQSPADGPGLSEAELAVRLPLLARAQKLACGNPGLQDLLGTDFVLRPPVSPETSETALDEMEVYLGGGALPRTEATREFLENLAFHKLLDLAGPSGQALLRAATLFEMPVPEAAITALANEVGGDPRRLCDLGLLVPAEDVVVHRVKALAVSGLTVGRLTALSAAERPVLARLALPALFAAWGGAVERQRRPYAADIQLTRLALLAGDAGVIKACAQAAVHGLTGGGQPEAASQLGRAAVNVLEAVGLPPPLGLLARTAEALQTAGEGTAADTILAKGNARLDAEADRTDLDQLGMFLFMRGRRQMQAGDPDGALDSFERLSKIEMERQNERQLAVVRGSIADILQSRGNLEEALRIRTQEVLPVFVRLGDAHAAAVLRGKIAEILQARGDWDGALCIYNEEVLPISMRLGDVRSVAVTQGKIADIFQSRNQLDEALHIRVEEMLPAARHLGDARLIAVAQSKIADILQLRGDLDGAFRIRTQEELPMLIRLGDAHGVAVTHGKIADILQTRGDLDGAMHIRIKEELPVFMRLGDVRSLGITKSKIAGILHAQGKLKEALRIYTQEVLPVVQRLDDIEGVAICSWCIARIELQQQRYNQAYSYTAKAWEIVNRLGLVESIAVIGTVLGQLMTARGLKGEACEVLGSSAAAFRKLGRNAEAVRVEALTRNIGQHIQLGPNNDRT